jgi:hypothetical protein
VRLLVAALVVVAGCATILGLDDPKEAPGGCAHACDLEDNCGCAATETCSWNSTSGEVSCRTVFGSSALGQGCAQDADCALGTSCVFGECRRYCYNDEQCGATKCKTDFTPNVPTITCADACTPVTNAGCPGSLACLINQGTDQAFCFAGDSQPAGSDCSADPFRCEPGAICHAEGAAHVCRAQCDPAGAACAAGTCTAAADLTVRGTPYGVCL